MSLNYFYDKINNLPFNSIDIEKLDGNNNLEYGNDLIVIPGFSQSSFDTNYKTLFVNYPYKLQVKKFKKILLVKFSNEIIHNLYQEIFNSLINTVFDLDSFACLENYLYKKCGELIFEKLDTAVLYSVLAKSAGAGPAIFMCNEHPESFAKLNLFAPDVKYIHKTIGKVCDKFPKTIVGWNSQDTKVRLVDVWFKLNEILPDNTVLHTYYYPDSVNSLDSQHEINSGFFDKIT